MRPRCAPASPSTASWGGDGELRTALSANARERFETTFLRRRVLDDFIEWLEDRMA